MNELQALDRKVASLANELFEVAHLLRSRYGETEPLAADAIAAHEEFLRVVNQVHRKTIAARVEAKPDHSRIA
jgi:hypothetical protein